MCSNDFHLARRLETKIVKEIRYTPSNKTWLNVSEPQSLCFNSVTNNYQFIWKQVPYIHSIDSGGGVKLMGDYYHKTITNFFTNHYSKVKTFNCSLFPQELKRLELSIWKVAGWILISTHWYPWSEVVCALFSVMLSIAKSHCILQIKLGSFSIILHFRRITSCAANILTQTIVVIPYNMQIKHTERSTSMTNSE